MCYHKRMSEEGFTKKGKPRKRRPSFSSGFEQLDEVYRTVYTQINASAWLRPFHYQFHDSMGTQGAHVLTIGEQFRFVRQEGSTRIDTQVRTASGWVDLPDAESPKQFYTPRPGMVPLSSLLFSVSPVFWPIASSTPRQSLSQVMPLVNVLWNQHVAPLRSACPELFVPRLVNKTKPYPRVVEVMSHADRAAMVLTRMVRNSVQRSALFSYRHAIKCWWDHFIDPALFKSIVSVIGSTASTVVDFSTYAAFTRTPDLPNVLNRVQEMGLERRLLGGVPFANWGRQGVLDLLSHWPEGCAERFLALPGPMLAGSYEFVEQRAIPGDVVSRVIEVLEEVARAPKLRPRQQAMAASALYSLAARHLEETEGLLFASRHTALLDSRRTDIFSRTLNRPDLGKLVVDLVQVWRNAFPQMYANYSARCRSDFISDAMVGLTLSPPSRLDFSGYDKAPDDVRSCLTWSPRFDTLAPACAKYAIERLVPRRGRGRPRKNEAIKLAVNAPAPVKRPAM